MIRIHKLTLPPASPPRHRRGWHPALPLLIALLLILLLPIAALALQIFQLDLDRWRQMLDTFLLPALRNTLALMGGVGLSTGLLGTGLAWLVTRCAFPGRRWFDRLLLLPMAVPGFIMGFVMVDLFEYAGPVQTTLRAWFGWERGDYVFPNIASPGGLILVLTLALYPYVYLLARSAFLEQSASTFEAAHMMGYGRVASFVRIGLPLALPQIMAGVILVLFETMTDYGAVSYFGYPTLSERIISLWNSEYDPGTAVQLALLMLAIAVGLIAIERRVRGRAVYYQSARSGRRLPLTPLRGVWRWMATILCALTLFAAFVLPVSQLALWAIGELGDPTVNVLRESFLAYASNSFGLAALAAVAVVLVALGLVYGVRLSKSVIARRAARLVNLGYAVPGAVIAIGVLVIVNPVDGPVTEWATSLFGWSSSVYLLTGTVLALLYGYTIRFLSIGFKSVDSGFERVSPNLDAAARIAGAGVWRTLRVIHIPLLRTGLAAGAILVFVDVMKELPATLLLRPFGMDTLALRTYFLSIEGWHRTAAIPALAIVLVGLIPVLMLMRIGARDNAEPT